MNDVLSVRTLNRTLLERQFLTERTGLGVPGVVERLVALQAQEPNWPYLGLWARIEGFRRERLAELLADGRMVRAASLRSTQHLSGGADYRRWRPLLQPVLERTSRAGYFTPATDGLDLDALAAVGRELLAGRRLSRQELATELGARYPGRDGKLLAGAVQLRVPVVHGPDSSAWGGWSPRTNTSLTLAEPRPGELSAGAAVLRYLAAFGPAGVKDFQAWSGLTRMRAVFEELRPGLRVHRDERGTELFDLPDAAPADPDRPVPVRFLPAYDNLLLGHADRTRVLAEPDRPRVMPGAARVLPTFLLDGFVAGTWAVKGTELLVTPFRPLPDGATGQVAAEADRLAAFLGPGQRVVFTAAG
ncbi:winged helix DNA-binding domain-containing protein [Kitasatospora cineracea]|uniref:Winged helix DNA-binding protein n=1 Tax=Kitasatospora cineracea TaxID=88074 RepID=A0A3N4RT94_9ACTN|nr:winged helix DNA-binding domain-containing protein [Kitasatospora cineracea]ROR46229.1 winged helix DNA-binding protein [Kitasatospora cineracea]RPE36603.1 winged helix DNA-binding protein [Kitasatospora cineracea]